MASPARTISPAAVTSARQPPGRRMRRISRRAAVVWSWGTCSSAAQHQIPSLGRAQLAERCDLLLLGEHRRTKRGVVHAQDRLEVRRGVADTFGHDQPVPGSNFVGSGISGVMTFQLSPFSQKALKSCGA